MCPKLDLEGGRLRGRGGDVTVSIKGAYVESQLTGLVQTAQFLMDIC